MSRRRTPSQRDRIARALERYGRVSQIDFDGPATIDGLPPIRRVASRINELRDAGWRIDSRERRNGMAVYRLVSRPAPHSGSGEPECSGAVALFVPPAPRPASPYDDVEVAA